MQNEIIDYYNQLAPQYDKDRFGNTYGQYIDQQEKAFVKKYTSKWKKARTLDVACGTGRFLEFAQFGIDASAKMIEVAKEKFPNKQLFCESASNTHFEDHFFEGILCFHLFMHLDKAITQQIFQEFHRILKPEGQLVFDVPSGLRRKLIRYKAKNWHAASAYSLKEIQQLFGDKWRIKTYRGVAFFPIHRIPLNLRSTFLKFDNLLSKSPFKQYASYLILVLEKR